MKIGILGATGYTGQELVRLLLGHPDAQLIYLGSSSSAGQPYAKIHPHLAGQKVVNLEDENVPDEVEVLFCALPHGLTAARTGEWVKRGIKVIDLGADFRLNSAEIYQQWYKIEHPAPELLSGSVYGLPELFRQQIAGHSIIANPGCYPTASLVPLVP